MTILERILRDCSNPATLFGALFYALVFLVVAWLAARALRLIVARLMERDERGLIDRTAASFITQLIQIGNYLLALILYAHLIPTLRQMGTALLASVGVVSVVLGLAAQNTLGNLVAGIALLLYRPFQVGDLVQVNAPTGLETGTIENLTLGYTVLQTFDNRRIVVPNNVMASQVTINLTAKDPRVMAIVPIAVSYDSDIDKARHVLMELARSHPQVQEVVGCPVTQLGSSSVTLSLRAWCAEAGAAKQVEFDLYEQILKRFAEEGIEIPLPSTSVVLKRAGRDEDG